MRILLVDDDPLVRESYTQALIERGLDVISADSREGLHRLANGSFDVAVVDMLMPDVDGGAFIVWSRATAPRLRIIAISGGGAYSAESCLAVAEGLGAEATFRKPVDLDQLRDIIINPSR